MLYARRGSEANRQRAIELLRELTSAPANREMSDSLLLFALLRDAGRQDEAVQVLRDAIGQDPKNFQLRVTLCDFLLRQKLTESAATEIEALQQEAAEDQAIGERLALVRLQARLQHQQGNAAEASALVDRMLLLADSVEDAAQQWNMKLAVAATFEEIGDLEKAEQAFIDLTTEQRPSKRPTVAFYMRHNRSNDALRVALTQDFETMSRDDFVVLCSLVSFADPREEFRQQVDDFLGQGLTKWSRDQQVLFSLATLSFMRGQLDQAETLFKRLLEDTPNHIAALNNLSLVLAERPGQAREALKTIQAAIEVAGEQPTLVDTRGLVLLALNRPEDAIASFQSAVNQSIDPLFRLHLAEALHRARRTNEALEAYRASLQQGLKRKPLNLLDQQIERKFKELEAQGVDRPSSS
jgi:tetratricopeptide (TPR) repeat protein